MSSKHALALAAASLLAACSGKTGADAGPPCPGGCPLHETCVGGSCQCIAGWRACPADGGSVCTEVLADEQNCGACGQVCPSAESCLNGSCECVPPSVPCGPDGGGCASLQTDPNNCGACGQACLPNEQCVGALCNCPSGFTLCGLPDGGQVCTDLSSDPNNCGACASGCDGGNCVCDQSPLPGDAGPRQVCSAPIAGEPGLCVCSGTLTACGPNGSDCVDTNSDPQNCGGCGKLCPTGSCAGGVCLCSAPYTKCASTGVCADLTTDPHNCGQCSKDCTLLLPGATCENSSCTCALDAGTGSICAPPGGVAACVDPQSDPQNCGGCNRGCNLPTTACASGHCACPGQEQLCGSAGSQTCVSLTSDPVNCGSCGYDCTAAYAAGAGCSQGSCGCTDVQDLCLTQLSPLSCTCEPASGGGACHQPTLTFNDVAPILTDSTSLLGCATSGCHSAAAHAGGLDLSSPQAAYGGLLGSPDAGATGGICDGGPNGAFGNLPSIACPCTARVVPGSPASSLLIQLVRDSAFCAGAQPMPIDADGGFHALSPCQVQLLTSWIQQGAVGP